MADEKPRARKGGGEKREYTTFRLYKEDGEVLSDLADALGLTIAEAYSRRYGADAKEALIKLTEERLKRLKGR